MFTEHLPVNAYKIAKKYIATWAFHLGLSRKITVIKIPILTWKDILSRLKVTITSIKLYSFLSTNLGFYRTTRTAIFRTPQHSYSCCLSLLLSCRWRMFHWGTSRWFHYDIAKEKRLISKSSAAVVAYNRGHNIMKRFKISAQVQFATSKAVLDI